MLWWAIAFLGDRSATLMGLNAISLGLFKPHFFIAMYG
jgi:hypothetical protein